MAEETLGVVAPGPGCRQTGRSGVTSFASTSRRRRQCRWSRRSWGRGRAWPTAQRWRSSSWQRFSGACKSKIIMLFSKFYRELKHESMCRGHQEAFIVIYRIKHKAQRRSLQRNVLVGRFITRQQNCLIQNN